VKSDLNIRLFRNVENVAELRKQIMTGQWQCCLVNPKFILDPFQLVIAANKALTSESRTTKNHIHRNFVQFVYIKEYYQEFAAIWHQ
jgi:hypothetical protein